MHVYALSAFSSRKMTKLPGPPPDSLEFSDKRHRHTFVQLQLAYGTIGGCYYLQPGEVCPYQFLISVFPTCPKLQLINSSDHLSVGAACVATLFWDLIWLPGSPLLPCVFFSSRHPEVLPVPSAQQLAHGFLYWWIKNQLGKRTLTSEPPPTITNRKLG